MDIVNGGLSIPVKFEPTIGDLEQLSKIMGEMKNLPAEMSKSLSAITQALSQGEKFKITPDVKDATNQVNKWLDLFFKEYNALNTKLSDSLKSAFDTTTSDEKRNRAIMESMRLIEEYQSKSHNYATATGKEMKELNIGDNKRIANGQQLKSLYTDIAKLNNQIVTANKRDQAELKAKAKNTATPEEQVMSQKGQNDLREQLISLKAEVDLFTEQINKGFDFSESEPQVRTFLKQLTELQEGLKMLQSVGGNVQFKKDTSRTINSLGKEVGVTLSPQKLSSLMGKTLDSQSGIKSSSFNVQDIWAELTSDESLKQVQNSIAQGLTSLGQTTYANAQKAGQQVADGIVHGMQQGKSKMSDELKNLRDQTDSLKEVQLASEDKYYDDPSTQNLKELVASTSTLINHYQELKSLGDSRKGVSEGFQEAKEVLDSLVQEGAITQFQEQVDSSLKAILDAETATKKVLDNTHATNEEKTAMLNQQKTAYEQLLSTMKEYNVLTGSVKATKEDKAFLSDYGIGSKSEWTDKIQATNSQIARFEDLGNTADKAEVEIQQLGQAIETVTNASTDTTTSEPVVGGLNIGELEQDTEKLVQISTKYNKAIQTITSAIQKLSDSVKNVQLDKLTEINKAFQNRISDKQNVIGKISSQTKTPEGIVKTSAISSARSFLKSGQNNLYSGTYDQATIDTLTSKYLAFDKVLDDIEKSEGSLSSAQTQAILKERADIKNLQDEYKTLATLKQKANTAKTVLSNANQWTSKNETDYQSVQSTSVSNRSATYINDTKLAVSQLTAAQKTYETSVKQANQSEQIQAQNLNAVRSEALSLLATLNTLKGQETLKELYNSAASSTDITSASKTLEDGKSLQSLLQSDGSAITNLVNQITVLEAKLQNSENSQLNDQLRTLKTTVLGLQDAFKQVDTKSAALETLSLGTNVQKAEIEVGKLQKAVVTSNAVMNADMSIEKLSSKYKKLANDMVVYQQKNSKFTMNPELTYEFDRLFSTISSGSNQSKLELSKLTAQWSQFQSKVASSGNTGRSALDEIKYIFGRIGGNALVASSIFKAGQAIRNMISNVKELNDVLTDLKKVTDEIDSTYSRFLKSAGATAKEVGSAVTSVVSSTADFAKLGYSLNEAAALGKNALIYANVGDLDISEATEHMTSTLAAFNMTAEDSINIVDKFNAVGNNFAISSSGIGAALTNSASALVGAGNSLDQAIALITSGNAVVQDPESVGAGLRTIALRIRGCTTELEDMGEETDDLISNTPKLQQKLMALTGVNILEADNKTFKSTYDILQDIANVYATLDDVDAAAVLEMLAGKNRSNIAAGILQNFSVASEALSTSANSSGSAMEENEKYLDSISGKLKQLQATAESFSNSVVNSELIKTVVDGGSKIINIADTLINKLGTIPTILTAISAAATVSGKNLGMLLCPF